MAIGQGISGLVQSIGAGSKARRAAREAARAEARVKSLEANRQEIIDPYAEIKDLSSMISNPFAGLQVATQAAEFQARESDISLAATLDTLRATGGGAGGATALAQQAARAKQKVSASIAQQEAANSRLRAQGEMKLQQVQMSEAARVQGARASGKAFVYGQQEQRELRQLDRAQSMADQYRSIEAGQRQAASQGFGQALGVAAGLGASYLGGTNPFTGEAVSGGGYKAGAVKKATSFDPTSPYSASTYTDSYGLV
jgi:hypothetical protein